MCVFPKPRLFGYFLFWSDIADLIDSHKYLKTILFKGIRERLEYRFQPELKEPSYEVLEILSGDFSSPEWEKSVNRGF